MSLLTIYSQIWDLLNNLLLNNASGLANLQPTILFSAVSEGCGIASSIAAWFPLVLFPLTSQCMRCCRLAWLFQDQSSICSMSTRITTDWWKWVLWQLRSRAIFQLISLCWNTQFYFPALIMPRSMLIFGDQSESLLNPVALASTSGNTCAYITSLNIHYI